MLQLQELVLSQCSKGKFRSAGILFVPRYPTAISTRKFYWTHSLKKIRVKDKSLAHLENDDITIIKYQII